MPFWLPSIPYPPPQHGYWSPVTSTLDWCEENYYATVYAAEIVNTLTNLLFMYLAATGIANVLRHRHDRVFLVTFVGYLCVGLGSFAFHATLKYPWQLVDELSMIYTTCLMFYASFTCGRPLAFRVAMAVFLVALALFITLYYHYLQDPTFHQNAYALLTAIVLIRSMYVMETSLRPCWRTRRHGPCGFASERERAQQRARDERDEEILRTMWVLVGYGLSVFLGGFLLWNIDNWYCGSLRRARHEIGLPWGLVLEGHGWWHIMTGLGAYYYIIWGIWLRHCLHGRQDEYELVWPRTLGSLPSVVRREESGVLGKKAS